MDKIYKILGKRGRITIPWEIRKEVGFAYNDVLSFTSEGNTVTVKREKICDNCKANPPREVQKPDTSDKTNKSISLLELLDGLSLSEQRAALIHLSVKWAQLQVAQEGDGNG